MPIPRDKKIIHNRRNDPCPVCGEQNGKCASVEDAKGFTLCFRFPTQDPIKESEGWLFIGDSEGTWGKWRPAPKKAAPSAPGEFSPAAPIQKIAQIDYSATLTGPERSPLYHSLLGQLELADADRADLQQRGLTQAQIDAWGYKTVGRFHSLEFSADRNLPGVNHRGWNLNTPGDGYLCPIKDPDGNITGAQMRLREPEPGQGRYCWLSSSTHHRPDLGPGLPEFGGDQGSPELPITVCLPVCHNLDGGQHGRVGIVEGCGPKPLIAAHRLNLPVIGAAGGMWDRSPLQLRTYLEHPTLAAGQVTIYPDAGASLNHRILRRQYETCLLLKEWGIEVFFGWWGQDQKHCPDIDEIKELSEVSILPANTYWRQVRTFNHARLIDACGRLGIDASRIPASHNRLDRGDLCPVHLKTPDHCQLANELEDLTQRLQILNRISRRLHRARCNWQSQPVRAWLENSGFSGDPDLFGLAIARKPRTKDLLALATSENIRQALELSDRGEKTEKKAEAS